MEPAEGEREIRLILIGKTGYGKSASGNTILGQKHFLSQPSSRSVTKFCEQGSADLTWEETDSGLACGGRPEATTRVVVVDVPGFGDTNLDTDQLHNEIAKCVSLSAPGPHAFLLVVPIQRYTKDESKAVDQMATIFGEDAVRDNTVILFTRGDALGKGGIDEFLGNPAPELRALMERCGGRYHVLNNNDPGDREQVRQLLRKVEAMVEENSGGCYTNAMFLEAEVMIREEQECLIRRRGQQRFRGREEENDSAVAILSDRGERQSNRFRDSSDNRSVSGLSSRIRRLAALSLKVLNRIKILVATALTGLVVGAGVGAAAAGVPAMIVTMGNIPVMCAAAGAGAALGGAVGGSVGFVVGMEADNVRDGVRDTLKLVGSIGIAARTGGSRPTSGAPQQRPN